MPDNVKHIALPTEQPFIVAAGAAIALWGMTLLFSAVPTLLCIPVTPRSLRMASMGVRVATALVGLVSGKDVVAVGALVSAGVILACTIEHFSNMLTKCQTRCIAAGRRLFVGACERCPS